MVGIIKKKKKKIPTKYGEIFIEIIFMHEFELLIEGRIKIP